MANSTVFLLILAGAVALGLAYFQYYVKSKHQYRNPAVFAFLRFISIFSLLVLLINPNIEMNEVTVHKPNLLLAVDNSASIKHFGAAEEVDGFVEEIVQNKALREQFNLQVYSFGKSLRKNTSFSFEEEQTRLFNALHILQEGYNNTVAPIILVTDGNQTFGTYPNFHASAFNNSIFPVVVGDTATYRDLAIARVNVNDYSFLNNRFPVEIFVDYFGGKPVQSKVTINQNGKELFSKTISLNNAQNTQIIKATLPALKIGRLNYKVQIKPISTEKDTLNNTRTFGVEVIDERIQVLVVTSISHPDLGALKRAIASNKQRKVKVVRPSTDFSVEEQQLVILFQPNGSFGTLMENLEKNEIPYWIITGKETQWNFLNTAQDYFTKRESSQTELFAPVLNNSYAPFQITEPGFSEFPPLQGEFGKTEIKIPVEVLLTKEIQGLTTNNPMLFTFGSSNFKRAVIFGSGIWKWRSRSFLENGSFEIFDDFIGDLVQYTASRQKRDRLSVEVASSYFSNETVRVTAHYFDRNYQFNPNARLLLSLKNLETDETQEFPFVQGQNAYKLQIPGLLAGNYSYIVRVEGEENLTKSGTFTVNDFGVEQQFKTANKKVLFHISENHNTPLTYINQAAQLTQILLQDPRFVPVQKMQKNKSSLIEWYYLLGIIILALALEWFLRKYNGLV